MSQLPDDQLQWGLGWVIPHENVTVTRDVSIEERARIATAIHYLHSFRRTPYSGFLKAVEEYWDRQKTLIGALDQQTFQQESEQAPLSERFKAVLDRFKEYLDHTRFRLSRRYGKASVELTGFDQECSRQYDGSFGYRLFGQLRNEALHKQRVVNVSATAQVKPGGGRERIIETTVADEMFDEAGASGTTWNRNVAAQLLSFARPVKIDPLLNEVTTALSRIEAWCLLLEKPHVERDIAFVRATAATIECPESGAPCLIGGVLDKSSAEAVAAGRITVRVIPLSLQLCKDVEKMIASAQEISSEANQGGPAQTLRKEPATSQRIEGGQKESS